MALELSPDNSQADSDGFSFCTKGLTIVDTLPRFLSGPTRQDKILSLSNHLDLGFAIHPLRNQDQVILPQTPVGILARKAQKNRDPERGPRTWLPAPQGRCVLQPRSDVSWDRQRSEHRRH